MTKDEAPIQEYILVRENILNFFQCEGDFFVKPMLGCKWVVKEIDDFHFLSYWNEHNKKTDSVVVKKNAKPMIYRDEKYTMIVAIDCVKIGFIFNNENYMNEPQ